MNLLKNKPKGATHYAIKQNGEVVYLRKEGRVINFCDGYKTNDRLGVIRAI